MIDKNTKLIRKYYADKGFRNAEVSVRIDNDSVLKQAVNVTFLVDRKRKIKIGEINFTGNKEFSDKRLRRTSRKPTRKASTSSGARNSAKKISKTTRSC